MCTRTDFQSGGLSGRVEKRRVPCQTERQCGEMGRERDKTSIVCDRLS